MFRLNTTQEGAITHKHNITKRRVILMKDECGPSKNDTTWQTGS